MTDVSARKLALLKKVLAVANNEGATEGEREAAMRQASNIMQKYNLSLSELPADQQDEAREEQKVTISADTWARSLAQAVGKLFFCKYFFSRSGTAGKDTHFFVGRQSNVVTAMHMSEYLIKAIKREASKRYKSPTSPEGRSFCVGAVRSISLRVAEQIEKGSDEQAATPGTALVLANLYKSEMDANENQLVVWGRALVKEKARTDNALRGDAFHAGKAHGKTVGLNQQVTGGTAPKRTAIGN
jgi:hypothetical protein